MASNPLVGNPNYAPIANGFFPIHTPVSSLASAKATQQGPFRGLFFRAAASVTIVKNDIPLNFTVGLAPQTIWVQGDYLSTIDNTSAVYGVL